MQRKTMFYQGFFIPHSRVLTRVLCVQELYESLEKLRPKLFRLASETAEEDTEALSENSHMFVVVLY